MYLSSLLSLGDWPEAPESKYQNAPLVKVALENRDRQPCPDYRSGTTTACSKLDLTSQLPHKPP